MGGLECKNPTYGALLSGLAVVTVEYSVRGTQMAVFGLMGVDSKGKGVYKGEHSVKVLVEALRALLT